MARSASRGARSSSKTKSRSRDRAASARRSKQRWRGLKESTHGRYEATARDFAACCAASGVDAWPVHPGALQDWVAALGASCLPSTIETYVNNLRLFCTAEGRPFPTKEALAGVRLTIRGLWRDAWRDVSRAPPLRLRHLERMCRKLDLSVPRHARLAAMLYVGHGAMLRSVELLRLRDKDIVITPYGVRVKIVAAVDKTRLTTKGKATYVWIPAEGSRAREMMLRWRRHYHARRPTDSAWEKAPSYASWLSQISKVGKAVGVPRATTHSLRAGGCTDYLEGECRDEVVKRTGRWASQTYLQYFRPTGEELSARLGAALSSVSKRNDQRRRKRSRRHRRHYDSH